MRCVGTVLRDERERVNAITSRLSFHLRPALVSMLPRERLIKHV